MANLTVVINPDVIDYTNLSTLIGNVGGIFPGFVTLISNIIGPYIILVVLGVIVTLLGAITDGFKNIFNIFR